ncbi:MAG: anti-sigma factor antagonist [Bacteroidota bacterium]
MISITIQNEQVYPLVVIEGRLDTTTSAEFDQAVRPLIEKVNYLIIDLSQCNYLSSAGIRILLVSEKKLKSKGGCLFLTGILPEVFQVIEMAGLHHIFRLFKNTEAVYYEIERISLKEKETREWSAGACSFQFQPIENERKAVFFVSNQGIVGYNELEVSIGIGSSAKSIEEEKQAQGVFITLSRCAGFIPTDTSQPSDFNIPQNPSNAGVFVRLAVSFGRQPGGLVRLSKTGSVFLGDLADALDPMKQQLTSGPEDLIALVIADFNSATPSVSLCLMVDRELRDVLKQSGTNEISGLTQATKQGIMLWGAKFMLDEVIGAHADISLSNFLEKNLTIENIISVEVIHLSDQLVNPMIWMFISDGMADASATRLQIETTDDILFEPHKVFLTRRLYTDSARLVIKQIHGGYSAQTYQVTSFNHENRKLRPTVLKIADRAIITRESDRCQRFALPYIMNNSAIVLGTEFFGDTGALRYNFVGIGGEQTQLKWLAHYFLNWTIDQLVPLFDKIFLQILNPWYGQPMRETIYPFSDHDPTLTFFPRLCEIATELLSVSPDNKFIMVKETGQSLINPYWFLKHEFVKHHETGIDYYTAICHGDLNMQNILLDEDMNVYLIDFSETRPRSVVSDFARLEAIFMVEHAPLGNEKEIEEYIEFIFRFYDTGQLDELPDFSYTGEHLNKVRRNMSLSLKMREYAFKSACSNPDPVPYWLALLEWIMPVVCYSSSSMAHKRLSMIVSGLLCRKVMQSDLYAQYLH